TIEHVLPQTLAETAAGMAWKTVLGANWFEVHQRWVHTLGNLTLTGYNTEMSNNSYEIKHKALLDSNLVLNAYFESVEKWDIDSIQRGGVTLATQVAALWPNPRQPRTGSVSVDRELPPAKPHFDVEELRAQSLARLGGVLGTELVQEGDARYSSP